MKKQWFVIDGEGNISWSAKKEGPESFKTFGTAQARARALAKLDPGRPVIVAEGTFTVLCPVGSVKTERMG